MSAKSSVLSVPQIVAQYSASVVDAPTYVAACTAIDALVVAGQVVQKDASDAKAKLAEVMAAAIAAASATKADDGPRMKVTPGGMVGFGRSAPGANQQYGLSLFPKTLQWLFNHRDLIDKWIADHSAELSWTKADAEKFAARKAAAKAEYEAKQSAK